MKIPTIPSIGVIITVENMEKLNIESCIPTNVNMLGRTSVNKIEFMIRLIAAKVSGPAYPPVVGILL